MMAYRDNGDGSYLRTDGGEYLYDYNPVSGSPDDAYESDSYDEDDAANDDDSWNDSTAEDDDEVNIED